jgi:hypothetical protein
MEGLAGKQLVQSIDASVLPEPRSSGAAQLLLPGCAKELREATQQACHQASAP